MTDINMIKPEGRQEILKCLKSAELQHNVHVLFAIESGSRAWGFPSPNSDYDARFVYVHPQAHYLNINIENIRDVIEYPIIDEMDINGWDLRKALKLLYKSNPSIVEWLRSPIIYLQANGFILEMQKLAEQIYDPKAGVYHYLQMAKRNYYSHLNCDSVRLKKYFYVLRPILATRWILEHQSPPPIEFHKLLCMIPENNEILGIIHDLLAQKKVALEDQFIEPILALNQFIENQLNDPAIEMQLTALKPINSNNSEEKLALLNLFFKKWLPHSNKE